MTSLTNPTHADEDPFPLSNIIGGVVVCAVAGVILVVVIVTLCLRRHRKPSLQLTPSVPAKADSLDRELGWSEWIMDVEPFRALALDTSHDKTAYSTNFENTFDSRYSRTWDGTLLKTFHSGGITLNGTLDGSFDDTVGALGRDCLPLTLKAISAAETRCRTSTTRACPAFAPGC